MRISTFTSAVLLFAVCFLWEGNHAGNSNSREEEKKPAKHKKRDKDESGRHTTQRTHNTQRTHGTHSTANALYNAPAAGGTKPTHSTRHHQPTPSQALVVRDEGPVTRHGMPIVDPPNEERRHRHQGDKDRKEKGNEREGRHRTTKAAEHRRRSRAPSADSAVSSRRRSPSVVSSRHHPSRAPSRAREGPVTRSGMPIVEPPEEDRKRRLQKEEEKIKAGKAEDKQKSRLSAAPAAPPHRTHRRDGAAPQRRRTHAPGQADRASRIAIVDLPRKRKSSKRLRVEGGRSKVGGHSDDGGSHSDESAEAINVPSSASDEQSTRKRKKKPSFTVEVEVEGDRVRTSYAFGNRDSSSSPDARRIRPMRTKSRDDVTNLAPSRITGPDSRPRNPPYDAEVRNTRRDEDDRAPRTARHGGESKSPRPRSYYDENDRSSPYDDERRRQNNRRVGDLRRLDEAPRSPRSRPRDHHHDSPRVGASGERYYDEPQHLRLPSRSHAQDVPERRRDYEIEGRNSPRRGDPRSSPYPEDEGRRGDKYPADRDRHPDNRDRRQDDRGGYAEDRSRYPTNLDHRRGRDPADRSPRIGGAQYTVAHRPRYNDTDAEPGPSRPRERKRPDSVEYGPDGVRIQSQEEVAFMKRRNERLEREMAEERRKQAEALVQYGRSPVVAARSHSVPAKKSVSFAAKRESRLYYGSDAPTEMYSDSEKSRRT